jgi:hypothetical protein
MARRLMALLKDQLQGRFDEQRAEIAQRQRLCMTSAMARSAIPLRTH